MTLAKIRTIREAYDMIKEADPGSSLSYYSFRRIVRAGAIPCFKTGNRYLLNYADVEAYFDNQEYLHGVELPLQAQDRGVIRKIRV